VAGFVSYAYYDPDRVIDVNNVPTSSPGFVTATRKINSIQYDDTARAAVLNVDPMVEGASNQPRTVYVSLFGANQVAGTARIEDLNTNKIEQKDLSASLQSGRADWAIQMSVTSNVPGANPDTNNFFGVRGIGDGAAKNGYDADGVTDIEDPQVPGANHVFMFSARGSNEVGWEGRGGNYTTDIQSRPILNDSRTWPRLGISSDLGAPGAPATITLTWNLNVPGREVPATHSVELIPLSPLPGEATSIDLRAQSSFTYNVENFGIDKTRFFRLVITTPSTFTSPQLQSGFNMVSVPVRAQDPGAGAVFSGLSPLVVYRFDPTTGYQLFPGTFTNVETGQKVIRLKRGWNLVANPYTTNVTGTGLRVRSGNDTVTIDEAVRRGWLQNSFFTYDAAAKNYTAPQPLSNGTLAPWKAYWVLSFEDVDLLVNKTVTTTP
jgi:hypothetical protein